MKIAGALLHYVCKPVACVAGAWLVIMAPVYLAHLVSSIDWHDPARCTLDAAACDKLRQAH